MCVKLNFFYWFCRILTKSIYLHYCSLGCIGIRQIDGWQPLDHLTNTFTMVVPFTNTAARPRQISPLLPWEPLRQGLEEGNGAGFYSIMTTGQKTTNSYFNFCFLSTCCLQEMIEQHLTCTSLRMHLLSILFSIAFTCYLLVVVWFVFHWWPSKANVFHFIFFGAQLEIPKQLGGIPPHSPSPVCLLSNVPFAAAINCLLIVVCCLLKAAIYKPKSLITSLFFGVCCIGASSKGANNA